VTDKGRTWGGGGVTPASPLGWYTDFCHSGASPNIGTGTVDTVRRK